MTVGGDPDKQSNFERHGAKIITALILAVTTLSGMLWADLRTDVQEAIEAATRNDNRLTAIESSRFTNGDARQLEAKLEREITAESNATREVIRAEIRALGAELRTELTDEIRKASR